MTATHLSPKRHSDCRSEGWTLRSLVWIAAAAVVVLGSTAGLAAPSSEAKAPGAALLFESQVRPLLLEKCAACHGEKLQQGSLRLDTREGFLKGGRSGALVAGKTPAESLLLRAVRHAPGVPKMPPTGKLADNEIAALTEWVKSGAGWPEYKSKAPDAQLPALDNQWAFRKFDRPAVPAFRTPKSAFRNPIDAFILAKLREKGLGLSPKADRVTLIRRATFDLTGLPPTREEVEAFVADRSPNAWEKVIDRLLASPRYGEKWGRMWLDNVRYADSNGMDENYHFANAWRYRDYVIRAFNEDRRWDEFVQEQIAGDLLPESKEAEVNRRRIIATGYWVLGPKLLANPDKRKVMLDILDEQIDVTARAFMGVTLACARCHDHKFDPLTQKDYYALAGILKSTRTMEDLKTRKWSERPLVDAATVAEAQFHQQDVDAAKKALADAKGAKAAAEKLAQLQARVTELEKSAPAPIPYAMAVTDGKPETQQLLVRGNPDAPGEAAPRGFPGVLTAEVPGVASTTASGRLELARWLTRPDHPLTARVLVNRVWQGHFGRGIVGTTDNFGRIGERPSHPELLNWLASVFTAETQGTQRKPGESEGLDWSLKRLHRLIMLSETYQQTSVVEAYKSKSKSGFEIDPENRLLWHMHRRHLSAEELRDSMLAANGTLDVKVGGSMLDLPNMERVTTDMSVDFAAKSYGLPRRSVYLPVIRNSLFEMMELFDFTDPSSVTTRRNETIVAPQALYLLNNPLVIQASKDFAKELIDNTEADDKSVVGLAIWRAYGRAPRVGETDSGMVYLSTYATAVRAKEPDVSGAVARRRAWESYCQALLCSSEFSYID